MAEKKPIFEFRPFERPLSTLSAVFAAFALFSVLDAGIHPVAGYILYLAIALLPTALWWRAKQISYLGEKYGLKWISFSFILPEEWLLPFPRVPSRENWPRVGLAIVNWLLIYPAVLFAIAWGWHTLRN